jgi:hypothetical protein
MYVVCIGLISSAKNNLCLETHVKYGELILSYVINIMYFVR